MTAEPPGSPAPRPRPAYGEYAPPGWVPPHQPTPPPALVPAAAPPTRPWDRPLTLALLAAGVVGMSIGIYAGVDLDAVIRQVGAVYGTEPVLPSWAPAAGWALAISHVLLFVFGAAFGWRALQQGKRAFWYPLGAGIAANLIYQAILTSVALASGVLGPLLT